MRQDRKGALRLVTTVGHFGRKHTPQNNLGQGVRKLECFTPHLRGTALGCCGDGRGGGFTFPGPCSLERWLEARLARTDMGARQTWGLETVGVDNVGHELLAPPDKGSKADRNKESNLGPSEGRCSERPGGFFSWLEPFR